MMGGIHSGSYSVVRFGISSAELLAFTFGMIVKYLNKCTTRRFSILVFVSCITRKIYYICFMDNPIISVIPCAICNLMALESYALTLSNLSFKYLDFCDHNNEQIVYY
jgi:hypothetical protein